MHLPLFRTLNNVNCSDASIATLLEVTTLISWLPRELFSLGSWVEAKQPLKPHRHARKRSGRSSKLSDEESLVDALHSSEHEFRMFNTTQAAAHKFTVRVYAFSKQENLPCFNTELQVTLEFSSFTEEKFELYKEYQSTIHNEDDKLPSSFTRFLIDTPLIVTIFFSSLVFHSAYLPILAESSGRRLNIRSLVLLTFHPTMDRIISYIESMANLLRLECSISYQNVCLQYT